MGARRDERFDSTLAIRLAEGGAGELRNISASGMYFVTEVLLVPGDALSFEVEFSDHPGGALQVRGAGRVVRVERTEGRNGVAAAITGFEFLRAGGGHGDG